MQFPKCKYRPQRCTLRAYKDDLCVLHMPKDPAGSSPEANKVAQEFSDALRGLLHQGQGGVTWKGFIFPAMYSYEDFLPNLKLTIEDATILGEVRDDGSMVGTVSFVNCSFQATVHYKRSHFESLSFKGCVFNAHVHFIDCRFNNVAIASEFLADVTIASEFTGIADFSGCKFHGHTIITTSWGGTSFGGDVNFRKWRVAPGAKITFDSVNLGAASFLDTNVETFEFRDVSWVRRRGGRWSMRRRAVLRDEESLTKETVGRLAENYRQLVLNYERRREYVPAEDFHFGEMEMLRRRTWWPLNSYALYRLSSGYGTSYVQAVAVLTLMILVFAALFLLTGFRVPEHGGTIAVNYAISSDAQKWPTWREFSHDMRDAILLAVSTVVYNREQAYAVVDWRGRLARYCAAVLLTGQSALVLFAIRRRFKR